MLDCAVIDDQNAETEFAALYSSFKQQIGEWVVEVPISRVVSGISDNANGAVKVSHLFGAFKKQAYASLPDLEKNALSVNERRLWQQWDALKCEMHKFALASQHYVGGARDKRSPEDRSKRAEANPDKSAMVHGRVESEVQMRLSAMPSMIQFFEHIGGWASANNAPPAESTGVVALSDCMAMLRWGFNKLQQRQRRRHLRIEELVSVSNALYALSKLFSGSGDHKRYYLNESDLLKGFIEEMGRTHPDRIPAFKGSRMHWLLEAAVAVNNNSEDLLRYLHELRRCTQKPNKLVACAFEALSDGPVLAAIAARAICFVEVISIAIFAHKHLAGRHYTRRVNDCIIDILNAASCTGSIPKLAVANALKEIEPDWTDRIDAFIKAGALRCIRVYEAAAKHKHHHLYAKPGYAAMAAVLTKHLDRDCVDDEDLKDAFVTSCQLESFFAVLDDVNRASNFISITENRGQAMAIKSHTFVTADERLRQEVLRRKKMKLPKMTEEEALTHLEEEPLAGWCTLTEEEKEYLYLMVEKTWYHDCRITPKQQVRSQKRKRLERKIEQKNEKEALDSGKRTQYATYQAIPVYQSMPALDHELESMFQAATDVPPRPRYSTALKTAIVREQLNIRKWVYGRKFREGFLDSGTNDGDLRKLVKLKEALGSIMDEEAIVPPVACPPLIRSEYEVGPNPTAFRLSLDAERNQITRDLELKFVNNHPGGVFKGP
jgi:hypothetical protein